jgi:predicted XRE-type DNA-binding protein
MTKDLELVHGSGNVFRDFGRPDADILQTKAILAAQIIRILDERQLSTRQAEALTGVNHSEFARIRNAKLTRFTIDRLMTVINKLDHAVDMKVTVTPRGTPRREPVPA